MVPTVPGECSLQGLQMAPHSGEQALLPLLLLRRTPVWPSRRHLRLLTSQISYGELASHGRNTDIHFKTDSHGAVRGMAQWLRALTAL